MIKYHTLISCAIAALTFVTSNASAETFVLGAIGDSLTSGFNAERIGDNRELSWSTGTDQRVESHYQKLQKLHPEVEFLTYNEAIVGARSQHLLRQVERLQRNNPDYVTISVGANNLCHHVDDWEEARKAYDKEVNDAIVQLISQNEKIKIFLSPIPDMALMREIGLTRGDCQWRWKRFRICPALLSENVSRSSVLQFQKSLISANDVLEGIAARHPNNVFFDRTLAETTFEDRHLSRHDCFHPSIDGQNFYSQLNWDAMESHGFEPFTQHD